MEMAPIYKRVIGLDAHQAKISACAVIELADGTVTGEHREFGAFKRDRRTLAEWAIAQCPDVVVMESTGIYWKSPYAASASWPGWSMPGMSRIYPGARPMSAMLTGWPRWHEPVSFVSHSSRRRISGTFA